ncbi:MAG: DUF4097 domain-containing protein [Gemmatimonadota bacterium]|nr:DUF4097 domain-containing protein [Gemmatimonadota bacterium]
MAARTVCLLSVGVLLTAVGAASAQGPDPLSCHDRGSDDERFCEMRETTLPAGRDPIEVDGGPNGGIRVLGWDGRDIKVRARVTAAARSDARARELADGVEITADGAIRARGPRAGRREWWAVTFEVLVPRHANLDLRTTNGGIRVEDVRGRIRFATTNGGVRLAALAGDVAGRTTNGGVEVVLTGSRWDGEGLDAQTTNGGVRLLIPDGYSAHLEASTRNGGLSVDFPITVQGLVGKSLSFDLGTGGPTVRLRTTNGSVRLQRQ